MENGGQAFPRPAFSDADQVYTSEPQKGMTLRDYFADSAMHSLRMNPDTQTLADTLNMPYETYVAGMAYAQSDAMLVERDKGD